MNRNKYKDRRLFFYLLFGLSILALLLRLINIQIIDNSYKLSANNNVVKAITLYPERGYIYDRNGTLLVSNQRAFDIMVIPRQVKKMDTLTFCRLINIEKDYFDNQLKKATRYSINRASIFIKEVSKQTASKIQEQLYQFSGFYLQERTMREYPEKSAAHLLGYVSQVPDYILKKNDYYKKNDNYGMTGVENSYEKELSWDPRGKIRYS